MPVIGIDHVQLAAPAGCECAARRFFGELLGLVEIEKPAVLRPRGGCWFAAGSQQLHIGVTGEHLPARKAHPAIRYDARSLDEVAARLAGAGETVSWDTELDGVRRFFTADPWGNRIELLAADPAEGPAHN